jgi:hypothetical protein
MPKNIVVRLNKEHTYRHLRSLCQNDELFSIIDYPDGWQDKDYERIVISDAEAIRNGNGIERAVIGTVRLLPYDNGTTMMFVNKDAIWQNEISESGEKLFAQYIERAIKHFTELDLILQKPAEAKNRNKIKTFNLSSSQKKLSNLRDELIEILIPSYPDDPYMLLKNWIAKATPIIRIEWAEAFDDFNSIITIGGWTKTDMATYVAISTFGNVMPNSNEHRQAWDNDVKEAEVLRKKFLNFIDGLLLLSPKRQVNSFTKNNGNITIVNSTVGTVVGHNNKIADSAIGENTISHTENLLEPAYRKIEQSGLSKQEKQDLKSEILDIENEINKGDSADDSFLARRLRVLKKMAPDIADVVFASLTSPSVAVAMVIKKVVEKVKAETV